MKLDPAFFPLEPRVMWTAPRRGVFLAPFAFISPTLGRIEIETGFDTDYASVPRGLWNLYPPDGDYSPAAWIHDHLYWYQPCERAQADAVILEGMKALGVSWLTRTIIYRAVKLGGGRAWADNARKRKGEAMDPVAASTPAHIKQHFHKLRK